MTDRVAATRRSSSAALVINDAETIGLENTIFTGTARTHYVPPFKGSLSLKSVLTDAAVWHSGGRSYRVHEGTWLLLNRAQEYTLTIESAVPVTTFCLFFRDGFVEDIRSNLLHSETELLDRPDRPVVDSECETHVRPRPSRVFALLERLSSVLRDQRFADWEHEFGKIALAVWVDLAGEQRLSSGSKALKTSTRTELTHRVRCGVDFMLSNLASPLTTRTIARQACLSEFHFHRTFLALYGLTPQQFLRSQRLLHAARILDGGRLSVTEVCIAVGFESHGSFTGLFRRTFGMSPTQFRESSRATKITAMSAYAAHMLPFSRQQVYR